MTKSASSSRNSNQVKTYTESNSLLSTNLGHGLSLFGAAMFIVGEIAGTGVLALPEALAGTGWTGAGLIAFNCMVAAFSGIYLGKSWLILEERWPEYKEKVRIPFSTIAFRSIGPKMATFMTFVMNVQLFGGCVVLLLLCAEMIKSLTDNLLPSIGFCNWIIIVGFTLLPLTFFGSPADFWPVAVIAMGATAISSVLITYAAITNPGVNVTYDPPTAKSYLLSIGTMMFSVAGACALPTFQNDMKDKTRFPLACVFGFGLMCVMYLTVSVSGYHAFGSKVQSNVLRNLPNDWLTTAINGLMASHVFCAFLIVINPLNLCFENLVGVTHSFNWKRSGCRTLMTLAAMFVGMTIPRFGKILNFIGASTASLQTFIMPPLFYICLCRQQDADHSWPVHRISGGTYAMAAIMVISGTFAGVTGTYFSLFDIIDPKAFTPPCYINECAANQP
ncbi:Proton-coupled amino acid transporter 4 [Halotydeus destructor]|nr:Proton-coupled amino acid transporter 4 [Halotydeus destructor]